MQYMQDKKQRPSKYRPEDRHMIHWIKYNKRLIARGELPPDRVEKFNHLTDIANSFQRINQYAYAKSAAKDVLGPQELPLFEF